MKRTLRSAAALAFLITLAQPAAAQDLGAQLVGMWKYVSNTQTETASGKVIKPYGDKVSGYIIYTKGGRLLFALFGEGRQKPAMPFTDADRAKLFTTLAAGSGTYKLEGKTLTQTFDASWHELWTGTTQKRTIEIVGNKLTSTSEPVKNPAGVEIVFVNVLERVE